MNRAALHHAIVLLLLCVSAILLPSIAVAQHPTVSVIDSSQRGTSFRGLSAPGNGVVWVSGSRGTIGRSTNSGQSWQWMNPEGYSHRDFRDIEAFDADTALAMAVDSPGVVLKTTDGGIHWQEVYTNHTPGIFLDAMAFRGREGVCVGDPINGRFVVLTTTDGGSHWQLLPDKSRPAALPGEACFAASGTNVVMPPLPIEVLAFFVSGGTHSNLHVLIRNGETAPGGLPVALMQGGTMTGSNSIIMLPRFPMAAGGDYEKPQRADSTLWSMDRLLPANWKAAPSVLGYISCLSPFSRDAILACGLRGVALYSLPDAITGKGNSWQQLDNSPWHVIRQSADGRQVFLAGPRGRIGQLVSPAEK